jgi:hypothetical protein
VLQNRRFRYSDRRTSYGGGIPRNPITQSKAVKSVIEKFREKYGAKDVKKYYSKFDVVILAKLDQQRAQSLPRMQRSRR